MVAGSVLVAGLIGMGCSSDKESSSTTAAAATTAAAGASTTAAGATTTAGGAAATTAAGASTTAGGGGTATTTASTGSTPSTGGASGDPTQWALDYTGGKAGEASGDPIKIGYVNQESFFPEATIGIDAAVDFANKELGGIGGRPIQLVTCEINAAEDGTKCGNQFANDSSINLVMTGTILNGNKELYEALNGKKAVVVGNGVTTDDFTTTAGVGYETGSPGVIPGLGLFALEHLDPKPTSAAIVYSDNPAGQAAATTLLKPVFDANGVTDVKMVPVSDTATAADVQSAMTVAGADKADVFIPLVTVQNCINVYDAIQALGINPKVVTTGLCFGTPMTDHLKSLGSTDQVPEGWYFGGYGYSYFQPDFESGMQTYVTKIQEYGKKAPGATTLEYTGFGGPMFANLLTVVKLSNEIGVDKLSYDTLNTAVRGFTGPMMLQVGPIACGKTTIIGLQIFVAVCANEMGVQQYTGGKWVSVADGLNGKQINVADAKVS
jgi:branched-chain amino acid transport system substrate-binding protein